MNRRGFFKALAATAFLATASATRLGRTAIEAVTDPVEIGRRYAEALARSLINTKEVLAANILNNVFTHGGTSLTATHNPEHGTWQVNGTEVDIREPWV